MLVLSVLLNMEKKKKDGAMFPWGEENVSVCKGYNLERDSPNPNLYGLLILKSL